MSVAAKHPAVENLRTSQRQLDMDGCEVGVSRQAIEETLALTDDLLAALQDAYRFITQPQRMDTPREGPKTATYRVEDYNALTAKIRAAIAKGEGRADG